MNEHDGIPVVQENGIYAATMTEMSATPFATLAINPGAKVFAFRRTENKIVETTVKEITVVANADGQKVQVKVDGFQRVLPVDQIFLTREAVMESVVSGMFQ